MSTENWGRGFVLKDLSKTRASLNYWMDMLSRELLADPELTNVALTVWWIRHSYAMLTMNIRWKLREAGNVRTPLAR